MKLGNALKVEAYMRSRSDDARPRRPSTPRPAITISRQTGTRGHTIGKRLVNYLNKNDPGALRPWTIFDKNLIAKVLEDHQLPPSLVRHIPEDTVNEVTNSIEEILGLHPSSWTLVHYTMETILRLAVLGNTVIYGMGGNLITAHLKNVVNVRLVGSIVRRIPQAAEQYEVSLKEAEPLIIKEDRGRKRYIKRHFGKDIDDPLLYDMVLNTDELTDQIIVKTIADLALSKRR